MSLDDILGEPVPRPDTPADNEIGHNGDRRGSDRERSRRVVSKRSLSDHAFLGATTGAAAAALLLMGLIGLFLLLRGYAALHRTGWSFLTQKNWIPGTATVGVAALLPLTVLIAVVALLVAVPLAFGAAVYISEYAPPGLRRPLVSLVDLMAAIPSIVYALWGFFFFQARFVGFGRFLAVHLNWFPPFHVHDPQQDSSLTSSTAIVGCVVALLVLPMCCSLMREVFSQAPVGEREAALALGASRWGMIRTVVLPFGRGGVVGAVMLGLGRALGDTVVAVFLISPIFFPTVHVLQGGGNSIAANIALVYGEASHFSLSAVIASGLVLFALTLVVNLLAAGVISRSRSGVATDA